MYFIRSGRNAVVCGVKRVGLKGGIAKVSKVENFLVCAAEKESFSSQHLRILIPINLIVPAIDVSTKWNKLPRNKKQSGGFPTLLKL